MKNTLARERQTYSKQRGITDRHRMLNSLKPYVYDVYDVSRSSVSSQRICTVIIEHKTGNGENDRKCNVSYVVQMEPVAVTAVRECER